MEVKDFTKQFLKALNIDDVNDLSDALMKVLKNEKELKKLIKTYDKLLKKADDEHIDYLQGLYEFFLSNRDELNQDYTPKSLAKLVTMLSNHEQENVVYDMCCGMGSLTIAKLKAKKQCRYILKELDTNVLPFLLFNLCYYKVNAKVYTEDVLYGNRKAEYTIRNGTLVNELSIAELKADTVISNPPFNLNAETPVKTEHQTFSKSLNYAWVFKALDNLNDTGVGVFILPNSILTSDVDAEYRKYLVDNDLLDVVVAIPNKFFINTDIPTTVLKINKNKPKHRKGKVTLIKSKPTGLFKRNQKGEDHMKTRVYTKTFLTFNDEDLLEIGEAIKKQTYEPEFSKTVDNEEIKENGYIIAPSRYIGMKPMEDNSRSFKDIINDIKRCDTRRGLVKLTINQTLAKQFDIETFNADLQGAEQIFETLRQLLKSNPKEMEDLTMEDLDYKPLKYLQLSKKKNELKFEQNSKEANLSEMFAMMMQLWIQNVLMWNNEENNYLKELMDKMLPLLMTGQLDVNDVEIKAGKEFEKRQE